MDYAVNRLGATASTDRLMNENYERKLYEGEAYQYWQKVSALKEKLDLFSRLPEPAIERAARTLLNLQEAYEDACDIREELGQDGMEVKIAFPVSDKSLSCDILTSVEEYGQ